MKDKGNKMDLLKGFRKYIKYLYNIRAKLIMAFLLPVVFIIILGVFSYMKSSSGLIGSYEKNTITNLSNMGKYLNFGFEAVTAKANLLNSNKVLKSYYSGFYKSDDLEEMSRFREIQELINSNVFLEDYIANIYLFSDYGVGISGNGSLMEGFYDEFMAESGMSDLLSSKVSKTWIGVHPYLDTKKGLAQDTYAVSYMRQLLSIVNKPNGYIIIDVSSDFVKNTLAESGLPEGSISAFITKDGREIINGTIPAEFKFIDQSYYKKAIENKKDETGFEYIKIEGKEYIFVYSKIKENDSMLCAAIEKSVIVKQANEVKGLTFIIVLVASLIAIAFGTFMASGFSNIIHKTNAVLQQTASGDLTKTISVRRRDEFHTLSKNINDMIYSMLGLIKKITGVSETVSKSASVVSGSSIVLVDATKNISDAVSDIEQVVTQQAEDAENCLNQMSDLASKINEVYCSTRNIADIASNTKEIVGNGIVIVDDLGDKAKDTTNITRTVINDIENLEKESRAITGIIGTMNEIAEQTNLLSLNASIEAARAGQAGRGFTVVAEEIRKLATQSLEASKEIEKIIEKIEKQTKKTVVSAKQAEKIVLSQEGALNSTVKVFTDINKHVESLTENLNQIAIGVEGIEQAKDVTLGSIESISAATEETTAAANQLGVTAGDQLNEVHRLNEVVLQLSEDAKYLEASISIFKIEE
ncbi:MAG: hypothetical protein K0S76_233 [Herbinix sp.]|jgi:methyl-accepting chemotaxis protein|nr:hypothetical protein [Herbinix sp.]